MVEFILWYVLIQVTGLLGFVIIYRLTPYLPDRGYGFAKPFGLLIWSYTLWLLASLHIIQNNAGGVFATFLIFLGLASWAFYKQKKEIINWVKTNYKTIWVVEGIFLFAFGLWALMRAASPDIAGTEKPMEMAFINAILHSESFPPIDPWLSGYAVSYYYFGYIMVSLLIHVTGVLPSVGFNLAVALWFAMTTSGAASILYSLLYYYRKNKDGNEKAHALARGWSWLAPFFILIVSNLEGFFQMLHHGNLFWLTKPDGIAYSPFWEWLNIKELNVPPTPPYTFYAGGPGWWFWRASRVVQDFNFGDPFFKNHIEIIDEFPFFTYYLADLHPHVLAMPFTLMVIGLVINMYWGRSTFINGEGVVLWVRRLFDGHNPPVTDLRIVKNVSKIEFWCLALVLGGLAFLNTWDFPIYTGLVCIAIGLISYEQNGWCWEGLELILETGISLGIAGYLFYLPFFAGFASQAGGFLPSIIFFTRGTFFWMMFGILLVPIFGWLLWLGFKQEDKNAYFGQGLRFAAIIIFGLWLFSYLTAFLINLIPTYGPMFIEGVQGADGAGIIGLILASIARRLVMPGTWITFLVLIALVWVVLIQFKGRVLKEDQSLDEQRGVQTKPQLPSANAFVIVLIVMGIVLTLVPEFFYLRDQFGTRMNTIFKFYYQAWVLWSLAAAFCTIVIWSEQNIFSLVYRPLSLVLIFAALVYPMTGFTQRIVDLVNAAKNNDMPTQAISFNQIVQKLDLDGSSYINKWAPDEFAAIQWLRQAPGGIIVEAVGGSYTDYARFSTFSGQPSVLGWPGHESQWRGGEKEKGNREQDIARLYRTNNWNEALDILTRYQVRYVIVGPRETETYQTTLAKFQTNLPAVYTRGSVAIFEVPVQIVGSSQSSNN